MGVDYLEFWKLNPKTILPFYKAFELELKLRDRMNWNLGQYISLAIASVFSKDAKYPDTPFSEVVHKSQQEIIQERFLKDMNRINNQFRKGGVNE